MCPVLPHTHRGPVRISREEEKKKKKKKGARYSFLTRDAARPCGGPHGLLGNFGDRPEAEAGKPEGANWTFRSYPRGFEPSPGKPIQNFPQTLQQISKL